MSSFKTIKITRIDETNKRFEILFDNSSPTVLNDYKAHIYKNDLIIKDELSGNVDRINFRQVQVRADELTPYQTFNNGRLLDEYLFEIGFYPGKCCGGDNSGGENEYQEPFKELLIYFDTEFDEETETDEINHTIVRNTFDLPISIDIENLYFIINENLPDDKTVGFYISKIDVSVKSRTGTGADNNKFEITTIDKQYFYHIKKYL